MSVSAIEINEIAESWVKNSNQNNFSSKFGSYIEMLLEINYFSLSTSIFFVTYLFVYEIQKTFQIIHFLFGEIIFQSLETNFLNTINYISLEYYISAYYINFQMRIFTFILNCFQFVMSFGILLDFFLYNHNTSGLNSKVGKTKKLFYNIIIFLFKNFSYSFNYVNIYVLTYYSKINLTNNYLELFYYWINLLTFITFTFSCFVFNFLFNDLDPLDNRYFNSVSRPFLNVLIYVNFILINSIILLITWVPHYILVTILILYKMFYFFYFYNYTYLINYYFNLQFVFRTLFIFSLIITYYVSFIYVSVLKLDFQDTFRFFYNLVGSFFISIVLTIIVLNKREEKFYSLSQTYEKSGNHEIIENSELFIYHCLSKKKFTHTDLFKHRLICERNFKEFNTNKVCICRSEQISCCVSQKVDNNIIFDIKLNTLNILSNMKGKTSIFHLFYLNFLLESSVLDYSSLTFLISHDLSNLPVYSKHLIVKIVRKFFKIYSNYSIEAKNKLLKSSNLKLLSSIIKYEFIFMEFLGQIEKIYSYSLKFWSCISPELRESSRILSLGQKISFLAIEISKKYGQMQKINQNQIKTMKIYSCFVNSILNDFEYSEIITNAIKENLQMRNNANYKKSYSDIIEKDFGVLTISGNRKNLFKILSCNKYAQNLLKSNGKNFSLVNHNLHYILPYPINIIHTFYLQTKLNFALLVPEKNLYCITEDGNLLYINNNICPCLDFEGKINFFNIFYLNTENTDDNIVTALIDNSGRIFSISAEFKKEFKTDFNINLNDNIRLYDSLMTRINESNVNDFILIDNLGKYCIGEDFLKFPWIWEVFPESKRIFENSTYFERKSETGDQLKKHSLESEYRSIKAGSKKLFEFNNNEEELLLNKNKSNLQSKFNIKYTSDLTDMRTKKYIPYPENNIQVEKEGIRYEMRFIKTVCLGGYFSYFTVMIKKFINIQTEIKVDPNRNLVANSASLVFKDGQTSIAGSISGNSVIDNKFRLSNHLMNYQNNNYGELSLIPRIVKKIYLYVLITYLLLFSLSLLNIIQGVHEVNQYKLNYDVMSKFFLMRERFYFFLMNVRSLTQLKIGISEPNIFFPDELGFLNKSLAYDISQFEFFLQELYSMDLSNFPNVQDEISNPNFKLSTLGANNTVTTQHYPLNIALNIYLQNIILFCQNSNFYLSIQEYMTFDSKPQNPAPSPDLILVNFIFENFFNTFRVQISKISETVLNDSKLNLSYDKDTFIKVSLIESAIFILIEIFIFIIVSNLISVHNFILNIFNIPDSNYIKIHISNLKILNERIINFINDERNISLISRQFDYDLSTRITMGNNNEFRHTLLPLFGNTQISRKNLPIIRKSQIKRGFSFDPNSNKQILNEINKHQDTENKRFIDTSKSNFNLISEKDTKLISNSIKSTSLEWNGKNNLHIVEDNPKSIKTENLFKQKKNLFYFKVMCLSSLFFVSFSYILLFHVFSYPTFNGNVQFINDLFFNIGVKAESNFMLLNTLRKALTGNNIPFDPQEGNTFIYYSDLLMRSESTFTQNVYKISDQQLMNIKFNTKYQYSSDFCRYFYNITNNYALLNPNLNYSYCQQLFPEGIQIYFYQELNEFRKIYDSFKNSSNHTLEFLISLLNNDFMAKSSFILSYFVRGFYDDLLNNVNISFSNVLNNYIGFYYFIFSIFILHFVSFIYLSVTKIFHHIYFYFENLRVLISLLPKKFSRLNESINKFNQTYF